MGISIELWRCRIGSFSQTTKILKSKTRNLQLALSLKTFSLSLRLVLFALLVAQGIEPNPGPNRGEKGGNSNSDRSTRSRVGSNLMTRGEERRLSSSKAGSLPDIRHSTVSNPSQSPLSDQPSINTFLTSDYRSDPRSMASQNSYDSSERPLNTSNLLSQDTNENVMPILIDIQRSIKVLDSKFDKMEKSVADLKRENEKLNHANVELSKKVDNLNAKVEQLEAQSRRENLKFFNIPESDRETWEESENKIRKFLKENLDQDETAISIERAHRLPSPSKPRPIIVKFSHFKDKNRVLQQYKSLKRQARENGTTSSKITVGEDFPQRVSKARYNLTPFMLKAIEDGKKAYLQYDKLVVNGKRFIYDYEKREPVETGG